MPETQRVAYPDIVSGLHYPAPDLTEGLTHLRRWTLNDVACIEEASADPRIPEGTTVPAVYEPEGGRAFIERQWSRLNNGEGLSLAIASSVSSVVRQLDGTT